MIAIIVMTNSYIDKFFFLPLYCYPLIFMLQSLLWGVIILCFLDKRKYKVKSEKDLSVFPEGIFNFNYIFSSKIH